jgi:probable rRNA maturation factor
MYANRSADARRNPPLAKGPPGRYPAGMSLPQPSITIHSRQDAMRVPRKRLRALLGMIARREKVRLGEIEVLVVGSREIARLNRNYLGHAGATDVISFDLTQPYESAVSGQLVLCAEVARQAAARHNEPAQRELLRYAAHGLLHLLGYDDQKAGAARCMRSRQEELLAEFWRKRVRGGRSER